MVAAAVAPLPPPPVMFTIGGAMYPVPLNVRPVEATPLPVGASSGWTMLMALPPSSIVAPPP